MQKPFGKAQPAGTWVCDTGVVTPRPQVDLLYPGTHLLTREGLVVAALSGAPAQLAAAEGQWVGVCGIDMGEVLGVRHIQVTGVDPLRPPAPAPPAPWAPPGWAPWGPPGWGKHAWGPWGWGPPGRGPWGWGPPGWHRRRGPRWAGPDRW